MLKLIPNEPALLIKTRSQKLLLIADIHLGFESKLLSKGISIPNQTQKIYLKLKAIIDRYNPDAIIILGDVKHETKRVLLEDRTAIIHFLSKVKESVKSLEIIRGNHDGSLKNLLPYSVKIHPSKGIVISNGGKRIGLLHGHAWPGSELFNCNTLIIGHNHPVVEFREYGFRIVEPVWVISEWDRKKTAEAFLKFSGEKVGKDAINSFKRTFGFEIGNPKLIIMPTFNPLMGGNPINANNSQFLGPLFTSKSINLEKSQVYLLDGSNLGYLPDLVLN